jgi:hypothetical protein
MFLAPEIPAGLLHCLLLPLCWRAALLAVVACLY